MTAKDVLYEYDPETFAEDATGYWKLKQEGSSSCPVSGTMLISGGGLGPFMKFLLSFAAVVGVTYNVETGDLK